MLHQNVRNCSCQGQPCCAVVCAGQTGAVRLLRGRLWRESKSERRVWPVAGKTHLGSVQTGPRPKTGLRTKSKTMFHRVLSVAFGVCTALGLAAASAPLSAATLA